MNVFLMLFNISYQSIVIYFDGVQGMQDKVTNIRINFSTLFEIVSQCETEGK